MSGLIETRTTFSQTWNYWLSTLVLFHSMKSFPLWRPPFQLHMPLPILHAFLWLFEGSAIMQASTERKRNVLRMMVQSKITKVTAAKYKSRPWSQIECSNADALHWAEEISTCKLPSELQWFILHHAFETDLYSPASRGKLIGLHTAPACNI